jgi:hypothetical protein
MALCAGDTCSHDSRAPDSRRTRSGRSSGVVALCNQNYDQAMEPIPEKQKRTGTPGALPVLIRNGFEINASDLPRRHIRHAGASIAVQPILHAPAAEHPIDQVPRHRCSHPSGDSRLSTTATAVILPICGLGSMALTIAPANSRHCRTSSERFQGRHSGITMPTTIGAAYWRSPNVRSPTGKNCPAGITSFVCRSRAGKTVWTG